MSRFIAAFLLSAGSLGAALAGDVLVIANTGTSLSPSEVKEVFLGEKQFAGTVKLVPVDNAAIQPDFLAKVMNMDAAKYSGAWTKKSFRDGVNAPAVKSGDLEVMEFVKRTPEAIGYVSAGATGVSVIGKF